MKQAENPDLRASVLHGLSWNVLENGGLQGIQFFVAVILARLLLPEQFGLVAMITVFMAISQSITRPVFMIF